MTNIRTIDMPLLDDLFGMHSGYVLNFNDRTFAQFFAEELNVDINDSVYLKNGTSKGKRLKCFFQTVDKNSVVNALLALWEYREILRRRAGKVDEKQNAHGQLLALIARLEGKQNTPTSQEPQKPVPAFDKPKLHELRAKLLALSSLAPQQRGYAFEAFLKQLFDAYGLDAHDPFRLRGEQIDGSFQLASETYLVEAKWQGQQTGVADLHIFHGKIEQKAAWTRGLFISNSGFTSEGLTAFGKGKRVICMDGNDLYETLHRELPLTKVLDQKVRRAAETGFPFVPVRDLFPQP